MKEEVRKKVIEEYEEQTKKINEKLERYKILQDMPEIKEFLSLKKDLIGKDKSYLETQINEKECIENASRISKMIETISCKYYKDCEHDSLVCTYDGGNFKSFFCLDCGCVVSSRKNNEEFENGKNIIQQKPPLISHYDIRRDYLKLLANFNSKEVVKILNFKMKTK